MKILDIQEDGGGYIGSASIAANPSRDTGMRRRPIRAGDVDWHNSIQDQRENGDDPNMAARHSELQSQGVANGRNAKAKLAKQRSFMGRLKQFFAAQQSRNFRISESFDMNDVLSRLSGLEGEGEAGDSTVSYGVEDDDGNLMKVTVRADQSEEFESRLATELADAARRQEVTGNKTGFSMAELLYNLNDEFDIVDVRFPQIPADAVYNADKVQYGVADTGQEDIGVPGENGDDMGVGDFPEDMGGAGGGMDAGAEGGMEGGMDGGEPMAGGEMESGMDTSDPMAGGEGAEGGMDGAPEGEGGDEFFDDESVEDMPADPMAAGASPEDNMITSILKMLTADADSRKAEADARAEEARAKQAEYSAMAAKNSVAQQEEVVRMEAEIEQRKKQEKDAKRISDLARYRVGKASGYTESTKHTFGQFLDIVLEFDEFDTAATLNKQKSQLRVKYAAAPGDDAETVRYKREALASAMREINAKLSRVSSGERYRANLDRKAKMQGKQAQPSMNPQQQAQQAQMQQQQQGQQGQQGMNPGQSNAI